MCFKEIVHRTSKIVNINMNSKVVLAYSGGLDTTYCAIYLNKIKNLEVHICIQYDGFTMFNPLPGRER